MSLDQAVSQVMQTELLTIDLGGTLSQVREIMTKHSLHHVPVLEGDRLVGLVSSTDLMAIGLGPAHEAKTPTGQAIDEQYALADVMESAMVTIGAREPLSEAAKLLSTGSYHSLPVVDHEGNLVGIITSTDLIRRLHELLKPD